MDKKLINVKLFIKWKINQISPDTLIFKDYKVNLMANEKNDEIRISLVNKILIFINKKYFYI